MQVKLKVQGGKHEGREIAITVPEFIIGRGDDAHLRPSSDLISRRHCSVRIFNGKVLVKDLGSRNGTLINDQLLKTEYEAAPGDVLKVGKLVFEIVIDVAKPSIKKPKVAGIADAVARTQSNVNGNNDLVDEESITDWLSQPADTTSSSSVLAETQQFRFDETSTKLFTKSSDLEGQRQSGDSGETTTDGSRTGRIKKRKPGKLPEVPKRVAESSKGAADDVLRKFFNRR